MREAVVGKIVSIVGEFMSIAGKIMSIVVSRKSCRLAALRGNLYILIGRWGKKIPLPQLVRGNSIIIYVSRRKGRSLPLWESVIR